MPRLHIDIRFSDNDVEGTAKAHQHWDEHLGRHRCGPLEYLHDDVRAAIRARRGGGFHQVGITRMSGRTENGVLTSDLAVHVFSDLFVVSSSAFVTSRQANSTFMVVSSLLGSPTRCGASCASRPPQPEPRRVRFPDELRLWRLPSAELGAQSVATPRVRRVTHSPDHPRALAAFAGEKLATA